MAVLAGAALSGWSLEDARAQLTGYTYFTPIKVTESSGAPLTDYQVGLTIDTAALVAANKLKADASDLRFSVDCAPGATALPYWIESGRNTNATKIWVRVPSLPANGSITILMSHGNAAATDASSMLATLEGDAVGAPISAVKKTTALNQGGVADSQRSFRFAPKQDIYVLEVGKWEPNGTTRTIGVWDYATQTRIHVDDVAGPAATYAYKTPADGAFWLKANTQYLLSMFQGPSDGYYFGGPGTLANELTYFDMRYCNGCTATTFPANALSNILYGLPDILFLKRKTAASEPVQAASATCLATTTCDTDCSVPTCGDGLVNAATGEECDDANAVETDACRNNCKAAKCGDGVVRAGVEQCDDTNADETDACRNDCTSAKCGDGIVWAGVEPCDDGNLVDDDACRNTCALPSCGDGVKQAGEDCDDGNQVDTDACRNNCVAAKCGDGVVHAGVEQCDDANTDDLDACTRSCEAARCGDRIVQPGEECEDGNDVSGDGCSSTCKKELPGSDAGTKFDDGAADSGPAADSDSGCSVATPGRAAGLSGLALASVIALAIARARRRR